MDTIDIGERCVYCDRDTSYGSGLYVNRIPADGYFDGDMEEHPQLRVGFMCSECQCFDCDECASPIPPDDDVVIEEGDLFLRLCRNCAEIREESK